MCIPFLLRPTLMVFDRFGLPLTQSIDMFSIKRADCERAGPVSDACKIVLSENDATFRPWGDRHGDNDPLAVRLVQIFERRIVEYHQGWVKEGASTTDYHYAYSLLGNRMLAAFLVHP